jgi:hypothetical protein
VPRVKDITGGAGARVSFDPVGGPFLEKLAAVAAMGGIIFEYGLLSMQPTPFPLMSALPKGLCIRGYGLMEITRKSGKAASGKEVCLRAVGGWTISSEDREGFSIRADRGSLQIYGIECAGGEGRDHCSLVHEFARIHNCKTCRPG